MTTSATLSEHGQAFVPVTINTVTKQIHRGALTASELKSLFEIDQSWVLDEDINGTLTGVDEAKHIVIKGDEVFFAHPRTGGSS